MVTSRIVRWIFADWWLKLIAILAAILLWLFAKLELEYTRKISLGLDFSLLSSEYVVVENDVDSVIAEVKAKGADLLELWWTTRKQTGPKIIMPLSKISEGIERIRLGPENVDLPPKIRVMSLAPYQIDVTIERRADRQVSVYIKPEGLPEKGYSAFNFTWEPTSVHVYGTQQDVKSTTQLFAEPLNVEGIRGVKDSAVVYEKYLKIELPEDLNLFVEPSSLLVKYTVEPKATKVLQDVPVKVSNAPPSRQVYLFDKTVKLTLQGPRSLIENLTSDSIEVTISITALDTGHHNVPASFSLNPAIKVQGSEPEDFHVLVK